MSPPPSSRSPALERLRLDGYEVEVRFDHLLVHNVPYATSGREVQRGTLVSELTLAGDVATKPGTHTVMFTGGPPCDANGHPLAIQCDETEKTIGPGLVIKRSFSRKPLPAEAYDDYFQKMSTYADLLAAPAEQLDPSATAKTRRVIESTDPESPFVYADSASPRVGITNLMRKFLGLRIGILGMGGTAAYVLDHVTKTPVAEIHIFDNDLFLQHNAFRAPGAAPIEALREIPTKVAYFAAIYSKMHRHVIPHEVAIDAANVHLFEGLDYVFLCIDRASIKQTVIEKLEAMNVAFIDVGMGLRIENDKLIGVLRTTTSTPAKRDHVRAQARIALSDGGDDADVYHTNIQVADLNSLNADFAVLKWKKLVGFYEDLEHEHFSAYSLDGNHLVNEDQP